MRTLLVLLTIAVATPIIGTVVIVAALLGARDVPGGVFDVAPRLWGWLLCKAAGVRVVVHQEGPPVTGPCVYAANHVSWFDVFSIASVLQHYKFVAKAELERIPIFGRAMRAAGFIFVDRQNRKAAFAGYETAAARIRDGVSVVVHPEGTRGDSYALRPFKKGPFVLAIAAGVPVVPTLVYGTREVQRRGSFRVSAGVVHLHFLAPIPTAGLDYAGRDELSRVTWERMAATLEQAYGIPSPAGGPRSSDSTDYERGPVPSAGSARLTTH
ncbi:MAG: 1-acyl-sn-glycerol-3-phosphate acyltransferase [Gemmatimonadetes bacterium]|nr:1-acyl-sn-glycerol-3-phosphate acyltransferase [Gemmatimonadota bacterium]